MPENIRCTGCDLSRYGLVLGGDEPSPIGNAECPRCDGTEFERIL